MLKTVVALTAFGATAVRAFGSIPHPHPSPFSVCNPDPNVLVWDTTPVPGELKTYRGWLKVPILHEQPSLERLGEPLGFTALRVAVQTKCAAGAKPILNVRASRCPRRAIAHGHQHSDGAPSARPRAPPTDAPLVLLCSTAAARARPTAAF